MARYSLFAFAMVVSALTPGCVLGPLDEVENSAPIEALRGTGNSTGQFGLIVRGYVGNTGGRDVSRVLIGGGVRSPYSAFDLWDANDLGSLNLVFTGCDDVATADPDCPVGVGGDLAHLPVWREQRDCVVASILREGVGEDEGEGNLQIRCEGMSSTSEVVIGAAGIELGASLAALPAAHPLGALLVGAPDEDSGRLYVLPAASSSLQRFPNPEGAGIGGDAEFGALLRVAPIDTVAGIDSDPVLVAAAAPGLSRVVVFAAGTVLGVPGTVTLGCVDDVVMRRPAAAVETGGQMHFADLDGDGSLELYLGDRNADVVHRVQVSALGGAQGCVDLGTGDDPPRDTLACPAVPGVSCDGFGAAISSGDFDGDGDADLLVGAPESVVDGTVTGSAFVLPGGAGGADLAAAVALRRASGSEGDQLGASVAAARSHLGGAERDEAVLGAPGAKRAYVFLCTGLEGDRAGGSEARCVMRP